MCAKVTFLRIRLFLVIQISSLSNNSFFRISFVLLQFKLTSFISISSQLILTVFSVACFAQDYEEYQPAVRHSSGASRYQQEEPKKEPIAILKQINKHNEDGSYTYGYEGADGSFKIETKAANGDVKGQYGYVDADGKVRTVEYGADKYGFQPSGEGITASSRFITITGWNVIFDYLFRLLQSISTMWKITKKSSNNFMLKHPK